MADVRAHATQSNCWSAVGGNVYDLTTWVSRHPGGEAVIVAMCGVDGTSAYNGQHGSSRRPLSMLALLKIGTLQ
ncbi:cytochrome b5 domain-containing protein [Candidatus Uhrbacteria bacterium]|nr:cytochrome b5 domain-containing protein [Candidatus Uhrbacteria bacterium]